MIVWGPGFTSAAHRHHSVQLVMAMRGTLLVRGKPGDEWRRCGAVLVPPDAVHEIDARDTTVVIGFVDAESELGAALCEQIGGHILCVPQSRVARWRAALGDRKSTRLNSSHLGISYAVFCLKKKNIYMVRG